MMRLAASLPFDIAVAVGSLAAVLCLLAGVTPWWRAAVAACRAVWSLGGRLRAAAAGWAWTALWMASWAVSWVLVRLRPRQALHCATADPVPVAEFVPAPVTLPRTPQPSASEVTVFDGRFGELRVRPFLEADHTWSDT
jgi:hypothetical protein